jgi:peroxiredoxin
LQKGVVFIGAGILTAFTAMKILLRRQPDLEKNAAARTMEAILIWFVIWKLSVLLFDPQSVWSNIRSLLYFNGGIKGAWLAAITACGYLWYRDHKSTHWLIYIDAWLISVMAGYPIFLILKNIFLDGSRVTDGLLVILCAAVAGIRFLGQGQVGGRRSQQLLLAFVIGHALISTVAVNTWERPLPGGELTRDGNGTVEGIRVGQRAPDFELEAAGGGKIKLSDYRGKKVLVNFWATWCPPCQVEMPHMQQFYNDYKDRDVVILSVNATKTEASQVVVNSFIRYWSLTFPVVFDAVGEVGDVYKVNAYPTTYVLDEQGVIRKKVQGPMNKEMLQQAVK